MSVLVIRGYIHYYAQIFLASVNIKYLKSMLSFHSVPGIKNGTVFFLYQYIA